MLDLIFERTTALLPSNVNLTSRPPSDLPLGINPTCPGPFAHSSHHGRSSGRRCGGADDVADGVGHGLLAGIGIINSLRHVLRFDRMLRIVSSEKHAKEELHV